MTVKSGDMLDSPAGATGGGERIDLHRVAGCLGFQGPGDAHRIGSPGPPFRFAVLRESTDRGDRLACDPVSDHTPDRGRRDLVSVPARQPLRGLFPARPGGTGPMDRPGRVCWCQAITHGLTPAMDKILAHPDNGIARGSKISPILACLVTGPGQPKTCSGGLRLCHMDRDKPMEDPASYVFESGINTKEEVVVVGCKNSCG